MSEHRRIGQQLDQLVAERTRELVSVLTPTGAIDAVNDEVVEYCGRTLEELQQWETSDTVHPDDLPRLIAFSIPRDSERATGAARGMRHS
jgi:PAS domain-containing protein